MTTTTTNTAAASLNDDPVCKHCFNRKSMHTAEYAACPEEGMGNFSFSALVDATPTQQAGATIADWRNLYEIVYGHECSFESFMATVDELSREASIAAGGAQEPIYQVMVGDKWVDSTAAEYAAVSNEKRIVYASPLPRVAATVASPVDSLVSFHAEQLEGNPYCYFELAYTRQTGWMAWITDRPAQGEPGTAAYAKSRKVIMRGQGETAQEACADALSLIAAASNGEQA